MTFEITVDISAPSERVWSVMRHFERWKDWMPTVRSIERLDKGGAVRVGSRLRIRQPRFPPAVWRLTALDEGRSFAWVTRGPGVRVTAHHSVEPAPGGSRARLSIAFSGLLCPLIGWITRGLNNRYLGLEAAGLKRRSEEKSGW